MNTNFCCETSNEKLTMKHLRWNELVNTWESLRELGTSLNILQVLRMTALSGESKREHINALSTIS